MYIAKLIFLTVAVLVGFYLISPGKSNNNDSKPHIKAMRQLER